MLTRNEEVKQVLSGRAEVALQQQLKHTALLTSSGARETSQMAALLASSLPTWSFYQMACPSLLNHYIPLSQNQEPRSSPVSRKLVSQSSNSPLWLLPNWELSQTVDIVSKHPSQSPLHRVWTQAKYEINTFHTVIQINMYARASVMYVTKDCRKTVFYKVKSPNIQKYPKHSTSSSSCRCGVAVGPSRQERQKGMGRQTHKAVRWGDSSNLTK